ncbi:TetR/AcrR family transcriptional regulator [Mycobacteroides chelonae]|uniref:HTH tetR-type domain-containing protein n=1 Tax=Mycobacteroides chelonae TaxID=1774 RepID=A0A1S1M3N5_MYCCH|nr:TetR/AcrR family transcriptional regulator [Mycobacteroides chelonae]OHU77830.1 hypothetical protein BKG84_04940 [Mycobacteroides chelonae]QQG86999.1 TetR/AcrR family transcriptional regulator [Mycobacteroides chelonae]QQG91815.1 TetR/AcrR family transcriptional regulator [Mycobacteroides chelonae]
MRRTSDLYGGQTHAERRQERRSRFVCAALDIWRESGWAAVTMRKVCAHTTLNTRYFYEDFSDRDELLVAVWEGIRSELLAAVVEVLVGDPARPPLETLNRALHVLVTWVADDFPRAQVLLGNHTGCPALEKKRQASQRELVELMIDTGRPYLRPDADADAFRVDVTIGLNGFTGMMSEWHSGAIILTETQVIDHVTRLATVIASQHITAS